MPPERLLGTHSLYPAEGGLWCHPQCHFPCASAGSLRVRKDKAAILSFPRGITPLPYTQLFLNILQVELSLKFESHAYTKLWTNAVNKHILPASSISVTGPSPSCGRSLKLRCPLDTTPSCSPLFTNHCQFHLLENFPGSPPTSLFLHWPPSSCQHPFSENPQ